MPLWLQLMATGAVAPGVIAWFMWRAEKKWDKQAQSNKWVANAIERSTIANMVAVGQLESADTAIRSLSKRIKDDAERAIQDHDNEPASG